MGEIYFMADRPFPWRLGIECSHKKHIIPAHRPGVPEFYPPRLSKRGRPRVHVNTGGTNES